MEPVSLGLVRTRPVQEAACVGKEQLSTDMPTAGLIGQIETVRQRLGTIGEEMIAEYLGRCDHIGHAAQEQRYDNQVFWQELQPEAREFGGELNASGPILADHHTHPT